MGLESRIKFLGAISEDQLKILYLKSSIYCLFSREESFSIAKLEALVLGLYVISTPAGCGSDFKKYGVKLVPYNNILKISAEIEKAIVYKNKMPPRINLSNKIYRFSYTHIAGSMAKM